MLLTLKTLAPIIAEPVGETMPSYLTTLLNKFRKRPPLPVVEHVKIHVVDESIYIGSVRNAYSKAKVTIIYDRDSLDSMYALAFFKFIYGKNVQAIPYHHSTFGHTTIDQSDEVLILGVDLEQRDLLRINNSASSVRVFGYRGTFKYLYDTPVQKLFTNVTLFQADNDYFIGGKGVSTFENTMAMMIKILYSLSDDWAQWPLRIHATTVAHATTFYENIPCYGLTKSVYEVKAKGNGNCGINNDRGALMHDLKIKLENCIDDGTDMHLIVAEKHLETYNVYRKQIQTHIERTRQENAFCPKGIFNNRHYYGHHVPAIGFTVHDIVALSNNNVDTTICVEEAVDRVVFYIFSKTEGKAHVIANIIGGE